MMSCNSIEASSQVYDEVEDSSRSAGDLDMLGVLRFSRLITMQQPYIVEMCYIVPMTLRRVMLC
jgi:hypothetical protein